MNLFGFTPSFLTEIESKLPQFLQDHLATNPLKCELYLPVLAAELLQEGKAQMQVLPSKDQWYGVTYAADRPIVAEAIAEMTAAGQYPDGLWK
jgi:hypothetical protein